MSRIALITGANKGLGFEIARQLGANDIQVILAARNAVRGENAVEKLRKSGIDAVFLEMDVTNTVQIDTAASWTRNQFGRLDILINNAGISEDHWQSPSETDQELLRKTFETNFFGAFNVTRAFVPLIRNSQSGRIVFMSSSLGSLSEISDENSYYYEVIAPAYQASKAALNSLTVLFAREFSGTPVKVNSACPGWVRTDLGGEQAPRSVEEGADTPVWLATLPADGPTGGFFRDRQSVDW